ncbi:selenium-binding protein SBP56-related protein [Algirhabdus cladophorae]|uniref:selenium-binding protein SBP56-related protein n=1 Tax=Algirhabdus cladophorae TaxID=3377108 RepID=UPI003B848551
MYLGKDGLIPLEVKVLHDPDRSHVFCGAALSSNVIPFWKTDVGKWDGAKIIDVENGPHPEWPLPVTGDMRQYDISEPHNPVLMGQVWMGGLLCKAPEVDGVKVAGRPKAYQLSLDARR